MVKSRGLIWLVKGALQQLSQDNSPGLVKLCGYPSPYLRFSTVSLCFKIFTVVQSLSRVWLLATPWMAACQAPLSFTISWNWLKFMTIESVMVSNHLILCCPLLLLPSVFPSVRVFSNELTLHLSFSFWSVLPMSIQGWFTLGLTGLILWFQELSSIFSSITIWKH